MGRYKDMRNEVVSILQGVEVDGSSAFVEVQTKPTNQFAGYPAATVLPAGLPEADFLTVAQNQRGYGLTVNIFHAMSPEGEWDQAVDNVIDLIDETLDALDQSIDLNGKCDFLRAVPGEVLVGDGGQDSVVLIVELNLVAIQSINVR